MEKLHRFRFGLVSIVVGGLLVAGSVLAQPPRDGNDPPAPPDSIAIVQMVDELATALSLTPEQKSDVSALHFEHFAKVKASVETRQGDREEHREAMDALRKDFHEQVEALLTDDQKAKYEELVADRAPRAPRRGQQRPGRN